MAVFDPVFMDIVCPCAFWMTCAHWLINILLSGTKHFIFCALFAEAFTILVVLLFIDAVACEWLESSFTAANTLSTLLNWSKNCTESGNSHFPPKMWKHDGNKMDRVKSTVISNLPYIFQFTKAFITYKEYFFQFFIVDMLNNKASFEVKLSLSKISEVRRKREMWQVSFYLYQVPRCFLESRS